MAESRQNEGDRNDLRPASRGAPQAGAAEPSRFEALHDEHFPRAVRYFRRKGFPHEQAVELTQDVFVSVLLSERRGDVPVRDFVPWLATVLHNKAVSEIRRRATRRRHGLEEGPAGEPGRSLPSRDAGPEAMLRASERAARLAQEIEKLPEMMRTCLILRYHHELSVEEAARFLGRSVNTVKSHLRRGLEALRTALGEPNGRGLP